MLKDKKPTHKQHGKPKGPNKPKRQRDSNSKGLESREKDRMDEWIDAIEGIEDKYNREDRCYI